MAAAGPWQRAYEREWRDFARQAVREALGEAEAEAALAGGARVSQADERALHELLTAIGARAGPPAARRSRKRAHSLTPQRGGGGRSDDSAFLLLDVSYVYRTPTGAWGSCQFLLEWRLS